MKIIVALVASFILCSTSSVIAAETLHAAKASAAPTIDGSSEDAWDSANAVKVKVLRIPEEIVATNKKKQKGKYAGNWKKTKYTEVSEVELKVLYTGDEIFFLARWKDDTKDDQHKPWIWNKDKEEYETGKGREDRLALQFPISGDYSACMLSGVGAEALVEMWQWKAARTNGTGFIHDKHNIYSRKDLKGVFATHYSAEGDVIYVARSSDGGESPYKRNNVDPFTNQGDILPGYLSAVPEDPDAKDVKAKGVWKDGYWTVEIGRKLNTGHASTDTVFDPAVGSKMNVAVFNHAGDHFHATSKTLDIVFDK